ncbi:HK97-gp10 family putative phage morphogenesis protein [Rhodoferax sp.]|uniref:HK97-gp10 family putative phage morphogenesis protein n=1 Tax=Rhodoferax sp. TaxID=50421 RepID=UPI00271B0BA7|nr:HK97-gp10 family putative phage morphogenesis protein [Rhodoferax sp.]MDO8319079.1 HK97 gp10 family phage protein [Rhodoferax sp.]
MTESFKVRGVDELIRKMREIPKQLRRRVLRNALSAGARIVRDEVKRNAPVLSGAMKAPYRKPGTVRDAIRVRTSKAARKAGDVGVFVNVKPASGANKGAKNPNDPFYWRWLEFGRKARAGVPMRAPIKGVSRGRRALSKVGIIHPMRFLASGARKFPEALLAIEGVVSKWFAKINQSGKVD